MAESLAAALFCDFLQSIFLYYLRKKCQFWVLGLRKILIFSQSRKKNWRTCCGSLVQACSWGFCVCPLISIKQLMESIICEIFFSLFGCVWLHLSIQNLLSPRKDLAVCPIVVFYNMYMGLGSNSDFLTFCFTIFFYTLAWKYAKIRGLMASF